MTREREGLGGTMFHRVRLSNVPNELSKEIGTKRLDEFTSVVKIETLCASWRYIVYRSGG